MWATSYLKPSSVSRGRGFTIVELLIVIVVIGILAAITIVAFNGVSQRANQAAAQSAISQANKKIALYLAENADQYPGILSDVGIANGSVTYQYSVNNTATPKTYCITATANTQSYQSSTGATPISGVCAGHATTPVAITNNVVNPSIETNTTGYNPNGGTTNTQALDMQYAGSKSLRTQAGTPAAYSGWNRTSYILEPGKTYTLSAWVYLPGTYGSGVAASIVGAGLPVTQGNFVNTIGAWTRTSVTFTAASTATLSLFVITGLAATATSGSVFYTDGVMLTEGPVQYNFADGTSPGWAWDGTPHLSTSKGLPV